jgi:hypothetical protein
MRSPHGADGGRQFARRAFTGSMLIARRAGT